MKVNKISRRAFLLGLGAVSTAARLPVSPLCPGPM